MNIVRGNLKIFSIGVFLFVFLLTSSLQASALVITSKGEVRRSGSSVLSSENLEQGDEDEDEDKSEERKISSEFEKELKNSKKIKLEADGDKIKVEVEDEDSEENNLETELEEDLEIEDGTISGKLKIKGKDGVLFVIRNGVAAGTEFPLSIDLTTNELIVTTPAGVKRVAVLPDSAVRNMILRGFITQVVSTVGEGKESGGGSSESGGLLEAKEKVKIVTDENGRLVYEIEGEKFEVFLGLLPVRIKKKLVVSGENGELLSVRQTLLQRVVDALSFGG